MLLLGFRMGEAGKGTEKWQNWEKIVLHIPLPQASFYHPSTSFCRRRLGDLVGMCGKSCPHAWDAVPVPKTHRQVGRGGAVQHPTLLAGMWAGGIWQDRH